MIWFHETSSGPCPQAMSGMCSAGKSLPAASAFAITCDNARARTTDAAAGAVPITGAVDLHTCTWVTATGSLCVTCRWVKQWGAGLGRLACSRGTEVAVRGRTTAHVSALPFMALTGIRSKGSPGT